MADAADRHPAGIPPRRLILTAMATGSALLAGCRGIEALGPPPVLPPAVVMLDRAIAAEEQLVAAYVSAIAALTADTRAATKAADVVAAVLAEHREHLQALRARLVVPPRYAFARSVRRPVTPSLPSGHRQLLGSLAKSERAAAVRLTTQLRSVPPALAQLMASISASETAHAVLLREAGLVR